jgi:hypothetical protein
MGYPYHICHRPYGNAIEETKDPGNLFPDFLTFLEPGPLTLPKLPTSGARLGRPCHYNSGPGLGLLCLVLDTPTFPETFCEELRSYS